MLKVNGLSRGLTWSPPLKKLWPNLHCVSIIPFIPLFAAAPSHLPPEMASERGGSPPLHSLSLSPAHKRKAGSEVSEEMRHRLQGGVPQSNRDKWVEVAGGREPQTKSRVRRRSFAVPEMEARAHNAATASGRRLGKTSSAGDGGVAAVAFHFAALPSSSSRTPHATACGAEPTQLENTKRVVGVSWEDCEGSGLGSSTVFMDEEAVFNTPGLIHSMAEGLLLAPPTMLGGFGWDDAVYYTDLSLWNDDS